ncbi:MAG: class I SAM-dependent methyltransferase [Planctomycetota bacterium]
MINAKTTPTTTALPAKDADEVRRHQEEFYRDAEAARYHWLTTNPFVSTAEKQLFRPLRRLRDAQSIFEIGCGEGANLETLRAIGAQGTYTGCDCFREKVEFCQQRHPDDHFVVADAREPLPFADAVFDAVLVRDVLHHLAAPERAHVLRESLRLLRPGGVLTIVEGNANNFINRVFAHVFAHERCMMETRSHLLCDLVKQTLPNAQRKVVMAEPSNFFRMIVHYKMGFPALGRIGVMRKALAAWNGMTARIRPQRRWAYTLVEVIHE